MIITLGFVEIVKIKGMAIKARIDTGARRCSIDKDLSISLKLGPIVGKKNYRSAHGRSSRLVVEEEIEIGGKIIKVLINLTDRSHMKYDLLIGREALNKEKYIIDHEKRLKK